MLRGLTANECRAGLHTALCNTANDCRDLFGNILAARNVIKEEQGLGSTTDDVVDTHCDGIYTDGIVLVHQNGKLDLGSASVGTRHENRLLHTRNGQTKASAKAAYVVQASFVFGACNVLFHQLDRAVARRNINACRSVAFRSGIFHKSIPFPFVVLQS